MIYRTTTAPSTTPSTLIPTTATLEYHSSPSPPCIAALEEVVAGAVDVDAEEDAEEDEVEDVVEEVAGIEGNVRETEVDAMLQNC